MNGGLKVLLGVFEFILSVCLFIYLPQHLATPMEYALAGFSLINCIIGIGFVVDGILD